MFSSSVTEQTEKLLEEALMTVREESGRPDSVLCETDRKAFVKDEASLRKLLKETSSVSQSTVWNLLGLASPREKKCLEDAKALCQRVKEDIDDRVRTRLSGESNPPSFTREPSAAVRPPSAGGNSELANTCTEITSPANPRFSRPELSGLNVNTDLTMDQEANNRRFDLPEAINTRVSDDRSSNSSSGRRRRTPPPPPLHRRMAQSNDSESNESDLSNSHLLSDTANARARRGSRHNKSAVTEGYGFRIINSNVQGTTVNRDSSHCSGAVIHTVTLPSRSSRPASQF